MRRSSGPPSFKDVLFVPNGAWRFKVIFKEDSISKRKGYREMEMGDLGASVFRHLENANAG